MRRSTPWRCAVSPEYAKNTEVSAEKSRGEIERTLRREAGDWDAKEFLAALALRHVRLVPMTPYGRELSRRIDANVRRLVGIKEPE